MGFSKKILYFRGLGVVLNEVYMQKSTPFRSLLHTTCGTPKRVFSYFFTLVPPLIFEELLVYITLVYSLLEFLKVWEINNLLLFLVQ